MAPPEEKKKWLITGASSGLGKYMAMSALQAGHFVLGTARNPAKSAASNPEFEQSGGKWLKLNVDDKEAGEIVRKAVETDLGGKIDVLINNAGIVKLGGIEDISFEEINQMMETNFFGVVRVTKAVMPYMRKQKSGVIANMSSLGGLIPAATNIFYGCTKFGIECFSEGLQQELSPFGVRIVLIEPGGFQTPIFESATPPAAGTSDAYKETLGPVFQFMGSIVEKPETIPGDPVKLGNRVVEFIDLTGMSKGLEKCFRLPLGKDAIVTVKRKIKALKDDLEATHHIASSTDCDVLAPEAEFYMSFFQDTDS